MTIAIFSKQVRIFLKYRPRSKFGGSGFQRSVVSHYVHAIQSILVGTPGTLTFKSHVVFVFDIRFEKTRELASTSCLHSTMNIP